MFFIDDGISGTSFLRSDFQRMQQMVEAGQIGTIIVKDLSRFGREQVEAGRLTQIVYPSLGVTFISIQENVNSTTGEGMEMLPFYNMFNEWFVADTSRKIRAVFKARMKDGKRCSGAVPYGYKRDPEDKNHLLIDEEAAKTVRRIFQMVIDGLGTTAIARQLTADRILIPSAYLEQSEDGVSRNHSYHDPYRWNPTAIASGVHGAYRIGQDHL